MTLRQNLLLLLVAMITFAFIAGLQTVPGYMDAEYYFLGGQQLAKGEGFREPILWNYLDDPAGLPHPSHAYWMPLASILGAAGMVLTEGYSFTMAKAGFLVTAILVPLVTARLSYQLTKDQKWAFFSGLLAIFSGFYLPFMTTTDTFALCMLLGGFLFILLPKVISGPLRWSLLVGMSIGLLHLSRVDGVLWFSILVPCLYQWFKSKGDRGNVGRGILLFLGGYILVMAPWMVRNLMVFSSLFPPGGNQTLWLRNYDQLFSYPADGLNFQHWWASGLDEIIRVRFWAMGINLQRVLVEQGSIFLAPLVVLGLWCLRAELRIQAGVLVWGLTFGLMTFVFPFAGARGGFFHASAALQPLFWSVVPLGLLTFTGWGEQHRGWRREQANLVFGGAVVLFAVAFSAVVISLRVIGPDPQNISWGRTANHYAQVEDALQKYGANEEDIVMVKNPPGYYIVSERRAIVIPDGDPQALLAAGTRYGARYIVLESDHTQFLDDLYRDPHQKIPGLAYLFSLENTAIFEIK